MRESIMSKYKQFIEYELFKLKEYECNNFDVKAKWLVSHYIYETLRKDLVWLHDTITENTITMYGIPVCIIDDVDKEYIKLVVEL